MAGNHGPQSALRGDYHDGHGLPSHRSSRRAPVLGDYALGLYAAAVRFVDILKNFVEYRVERGHAPNGSLGANPCWLKRLVRASVSAMAAVSIPLTLGTLATAHWLSPGCWAQAMRAR